MSMKRKLLRSKARHKMKMEGLQKVNHRFMMYNPVTKQMEKASSFFADHWREYV